MSIISKTGVSVTLVKQTIGAGVNDVGGLCVHKNINKWAEYKPNRVGYGNFGFALAMSDDGYYKFDYLRPGGGSAQPFRLGDFRGYDHGAEAPEFLLPSQQPLMVTSPLLVVDVYYTIPIPVVAAMPGVLDVKSFLCLTSNFPHEVAGNVINEIYDALPLNDTGEYHFKATFRGLNIPNGQELVKKLTVGVYKRKDIDVDTDVPTNFDFWYVIGDIREDASSLVAELRFVGKQDIVEADEIEETSIFSDNVEYGTVYFNVISRTTMDANVIVTNARAITSAAIGKSIEIIIYPEEEDPYVGAYCGPLTAEPQTFTARTNLKHIDMRYITLTITI